MARTRMRNSRFGSAASNNAWLPSFSGVDQGVPSRCNTGCFGEAESEVKEFTCSGRICSHGRAEPDRSPSIPTSRVNTSKFHASGLALFPVSQAIGPHERGRPRLWPPSKLILPTTI